MLVKHELLKFWALYCFHHLLDHIRVHIFQTRHEAGESVEFQRLAD